jgi:hypothetical protein
MNGNAEYGRAEFDLRRLSSLARGALTIHSGGAVMARPGRPEVVRAEACTAAGYHAGDLERDRPAPLGHPPGESDRLPRSDADVERSGEHGGAVATGRLRSILSSIFGRTVACCSSVNSPRIIR